MNNREIVAMLEECQQTAAVGPMEPTDEAKESFQSCRASLSGELSSLLQDAAGMKWPFVPEKWQYKQAVTSEDKTSLKELISRHLPQLLMYLRASILAGEPLWAASVVFLVDRFLYWVDTSKSLLKIAEALHKHYPATPIAPQVVIRQARLSLNSGKLQKAEYILSSLINNSGATGCWVYQADSDRVLVQAVSVQIRGQVLQKLGMWTEAAELIWASLIGLHALPEPDRKGIGTSLGLLANILVSMNDRDFQAFIVGQHMDLRLLKERGHRLLAAAEAAKMAVIYSQYDSLYVLTNVVTQGTCLLAYSFSPGCGPTEREAVLSEAKEAFQIGLLTKREGEVVTSKQELHTLIKAAYSLTNTHKWLGSARGQVREASQLCQKVVEKLHSYSAVGGEEKDQLGVEIMGLVGRVKVVLGVKPFAKSDERSFIPDGYRSAEETPVRVSVDCFSQVMVRFRKHHASVCEARNMSCNAVAYTRGVKECSVACITTMMTATKTLATEDFTKESMPLRRRPDRQTNGRHVDQQCSSEFPGNEETDGATRSEEGGFNGMGKNRSTSCSFRDGPASRVDAKVRRKDRNVKVRASRKVETRVDQKCLTEVSDEDGENVSSEDPGSLAGCKGRAAGEYQLRPCASTRGSSPLPSSWESISSPDRGNKKVDQQCPTEFSDEEADVETSLAGRGLNGMGNVRSASSSRPGDPSSFIATREIGKGKGAMTHARQRVETWVDQQCPTEFSDEELNGETDSGGLGIKGMVKARTSRSAVGDGPPSFIKPKSLSQAKDSVIRDKPRSGVWVDQQCPTEFSDEEVGGETGLAGRGCEGMGNAMTASSPLGDSLGSDSSWQKLCLSDVGSPVTSGKNTRRPSDNRTEDEWVNLDCPKEAKDEEELEKVGVAVKETRRVRSSLNDSLSSSSSWQKLSFSDAGSLRSSSGGAVSTARQRGDMWVDPQGPTEGSDEEDQRGTKPFPVCALKHDRHLPAPHQVDPKADTEDYVLGDLSISADYEELKDSPAEIGGIGQFGEQKSCGIMENGEGHERDFGNLCLDDHPQPTNKNQSHDQGLWKCLMCSEIPDCLPTLTEQDYKALLSGVCHKCLLKRLDIKKTFRLRTHRTAYSALLLKYSKVSDCWTSRETKVFIGDSMEKQGCQRTAFWVQILHQEEILGSYVGKTYRFEKEIRYHLTDVERQMTAQYYVTEFNKRLYEKSIPAQIFFIPSEVLLILEGDVITDCVTIEPYMQGDFVKLTNNTVYTNQNYEATAYGIAFGHFTYQLSGGTEVVVDLQGWVTDNGKGLTYLTDPQIHSVREGGSHTRRGEWGIKQFLENQHGPQCNEICNTLSLGQLQ